MGMAASQVRLLQLTARKNSIGWQLENLSMQKMALSRDMQKVTLNYQNALSSKTLKWSNNSGATYVDLSYANLMRPGSANQNKPYLITNSAGKVVIDNQYKKYAEMISPDGAAGGDYESNRTAILESLTGISADKIENGVNTSNTVTAAEEKINTLQEEADILESKCTEKVYYDDFFKNCLGNIGSGFQWDGAASTNVGDDYEYTQSHNSGHWRLGQDATSSKNQLKELLEQLKENVFNSLSDDDYEAFVEACDSTYNAYCTYIDTANSADSDNEQVAVSKFSSNGYFGIRIDNFIDSLMGAYRSAGGSYAQSDVDTSKYYYMCIDRNSTEYSDYLAKLDELEAAKGEHNTAVDEDNQVLTSAEETQIAFYDQIFTAIADKGWVGNSQVSDTDYLNQMLQNNQYYITTMTSAEDEEGEIYYEYSSNIASNFDQIFTVNDSDAQEEAQIEYEYQKSLINEKESRIDTRMQNLQTEQSAITEMIKGIETVRDDNGERNFGIFA